MADLTLTIGTLTASVTATNAKATALLDGFADAIGATGTNQQRANAVMQALVRYMREAAQGSKRRAVADLAVTSAQSEIDALDWG